MIKKILSYLAVLTAVAGTSVASYKTGWYLGTKLGNAIVRRFYPQPRISEINVWNGPIPAYPGK